MADQTEDAGAGEADEAAFVADWEAMADGDGAGSPGDPSSTRVLDQSEIDSLLDVDQGGDGDGASSGIMAIVNSALVSYERLPMLEVVLDRLVRMMTTSLRNFTSDNVEVSLDRGHPARAELLAEFQDQAAVRRCRHVRRSNGTKRREHRRTHRQQAGRLWGLT